MIKILFVLLASGASAFVVPTFGTNQRLGWQVLFAEPLLFSKADLAGKGLQLEEREDKDSGITRLWLNEDGSVKMDLSDGPPVETFCGIWSLRDSGENPFQMEVIRTYGAGRNTTELNRIGEFSYDIKRKFVGDFASVGGLVAITGTIHQNDEDKGVEYEVGYFSLIDGAEEIKIALRS
mmetsp:Transcript_13992/g.25309  ORF Transcript_13992/g.25309 Transcript_13992/m.25309 type:complete len:179 (-) Transcript_13992:580-1116(-)|eukprot:CAMPEP_0198285294 /NCGR_PEP_ID=MMETSP1449-20131203/4625_1 /TAXON_ID=420275 /ORGANISM="Attheya septentrionalis, Strain CCMP2084" /LENGTH=178 /DNA_ID=CAMNT_0043982679 /DNA_START=228 /DNA_END=764 /DNA_ORIENTATION=-